MKKVLSPIRLWLAIVSISFLWLYPLAQTQPAPSSKKNKAESCDGVLDLVPTKPMTFARKRRPSGNEGKSPSAPTTPTTVEAKPAKPGKN